MVLGLCWSVIAFAQCPKVVDFSVQHTSPNSEYEGNIKIKLTADLPGEIDAIIYQVHKNEPVMLFDNKAIIDRKNHSVSFINLSSGTYLIRINSKPCDAVYIGKDQEIKIN